MSGKLTNQTESKTRGVQLTRIQNAPFKLCIQESLDKKFCFNKLSGGKHLREWHNFVEETVGKKLSISEVDSLFLRIKGEVSVEQKIHGITRKVVHYGKDKKTFRIHGYYNDDGYFVIHKIDPTHKEHKS